MTTDIKLVVVGDNGIGKTSLLLTYQTETFPDAEYVPSKCDSFTVNRDVDGQSIALAIFECGRENDSYDPVRTLLYTNTQVFLVCFALNDRASFENVTERWTPEIKHHCPDAPFILCGLKADMRLDTDSNNPLNMVDASEAQQLVSDIGASQYIELSSLHQSNVERAFEDAIRCVIHGRLHLQIDNAAVGAARAAMAPQREPFTCNCEVDWSEVMNQSWMALTFVFALGLYILLDVFALVVAVDGYDTNEACWTALSSSQHTLWIHPRTFLIVGATVSLVSICLGMCFKALFGVDEEQQDWPRLCVLIFYFSWCVAGYVLCAQIYDIAECHGQSVGKICIAW
eukprot:CAMPEP_0202709172 /NCGR_PEP_ID=MMETSP1385-20130828/21299_1 /ASSEMBLY_ACC=CAM_ASM_000861 /TAXON_ID=933848 /ORGANISM="Elphidium margaritaceum" /LENGTH=341 /DNA_ID=CAMNT_0049368345 /DNA_START=1 /DNA_END=1023 /DNA_ORIENTATION=+